MNDKTPEQTLIDLLEKYGNESLVTEFMEAMKNYVDWRFAELSANIERFAIVNDLNTAWLPEK